MNPLDVGAGVVMGLVVWFIYDLGKQAGRREVRKLVRFGVDPEEWEFEAEPRGAVPEELAQALEPPPPPAPTPGRVLSLQR